MSEFRDESGDVLICRYLRERCQHLDKNYLPSLAASHQDRYFRCLENIKKVFKHSKFDVDDARYVPGMKELLDRVIRATPNEWICSCLTMNLDCRITSIKCVSGLGKRIQNKKMNSN